MLMRLDLADPAVADQLHGEPEVAAELAALLAAGLEDDLGLGDLLDQLPAFGDIVRQRFLAVDVLAGAGGEDAGEWRASGREWRSRTASSPFRSSSFRKSLERCAALVLALLVLAVAVLDASSGHRRGVRATTSQTATTWTSPMPRKPPRWPRPMTPTPMKPRLMRSLAAFGSSASSWPASGSAAELAAMDCRKRRRERERVMMAFLR